MALDSDLDTLATAVETLTGNVYSKGEADGKFATKTRVDEVATTASTALTKAGANETAISGLQGSVSGLDTRLSAAEGTISTHSGQISGLQGEVADLKADNGPIAKAQTTANEAKIAANNAQTIADAAQEAADAAQEAADAAQGTANTAVAYAATAQAAADAAQGAADAADEKAAAAGAAASNAQGTANDALAKANANEAKFNEYYTKDEVDGKVGAIVTNGNDTASDDTIKGAKKYTDEKVATVNTAVNKLKEDIGNLTNVMNFIGKSTTDPSTGVVTIGGEVITPKAGDVVVYGAFEYVYVNDTDKWEIFGNVTADESRFEGIEDRLDSAEDRLDVAEGDIALLKDADAGFTTSVNNLSSRVKTLEDEMDAAEGRLTATEGVANAAATKVALEEEVTRATERENAIETYAQEGFAAQLIVNNEIKQSVTNITDATNGLLAWGEF